MSNTGAQPILSDDPIADPPVMQDTVGDLQSVVAQPPEIVDHHVPAMNRSDCVKMALSENRNYLQKTGIRDRARLDAVIAQATLYRPSLKADYTKVLDDPDFGGGRIGADIPVGGVRVAPFVRTAWDDSDDSYTSSYGIAFSRRVFALAENVRLRLPLSQAEVEYLAAAYDLLDASKQLERDVTRAFLAVQNAQVRARVRQARVKDAKAFLDNVDINVKHGFRPKADRLFAEISLNQAEADLVRDRAAERDAIERLLILLAQPLNAEVELVPEDLEQQPQLPGAFDVDLALVLSRHESLLIADARLGLLDKRAQVARDEVNPEVTATVLAERRLEGDQPFSGTDVDDDRLSLRLDLALPLDGQRIERANLQKIRQQIEDVRLSRADTAARLEQSLRSAWRGWERSRVETELAATRVVTERNRLEAVLARYEAGDVDNLEVTRAKEALDDAEIRLLDARISLANTIAEYRSILPAQASLTDQAP